MIWLTIANIAGIARDDGFSLSQKKSQSATNTGDIIIEYTGSTFVSDNHSLVWWNNNGATWTWITTEIPGWFQRIAREWKIQELNGDVGRCECVYATCWILRILADKLLIWSWFEQGDLGDFSGATTFVAGTLSWSNLLFNYNFTQMVTILHLPSHILIPGSTKMFWLKSNNGTYIDAWVTLATTDGQTIQQWNDYSTSVFNMTQLTAANRPIYRKNSLNNNPGLQFTNSTHYLSRATGISWTTNPVFTYYFVGSSQKAIGSTGTLLWFRNTTLGWYPMFTSSLNSFSIYLEATTPITARYSRAITNPNKWILSLSRSWTGVYISSYNGSIATATNAALFTAATTGQPMYIGNRRATAADTNSFSWVMNEMLIYTWVITGNEHQKILSYLACKYGTTLDQTTPYNYLLSNNVVSWNASEDTNYKTNIGCIARDSWFSLYQTGSRSNSNSWDILVEQTWSLTDMRSLSWANNNAATGTWTTTEVPGNKIRRFAREWRFQENNGDIGNIRMTYASWSLPTGFTGTLVLVRDNDGNFSTGQIAWSTGTLSGTNWEFSTSIGDSEYVTFMELGGIDAVNDTFILTEDLTWSTNVLTNDTGSSLSVYRIATLPTNWNLYLSGSTGSTLVTLATTDFNIGNLVYRWNQDYCGADSFYYQLSDTGLLLNRYDYATGSITVNCINDAPIANDDSLIVSEDSIATTMNLIANDTDVDSWDSLSISWIVSTTSNGILTIDSSTGVSYSPDANFCWTDTFTYTTADLFGPLESNIATWTITINCINDAPVANNDTPSVTEDSISNIFSILSNDTDSDIGDTLSISGIIATTSNGTLTTSGTTQVVYTPDANFCGTDTFTYRARDSFWPTASNTATGTITVTCVNDAPVANNDIRTATGTEDTLLTIFVTANDTDIDNAITSITGLTQPSTGGTLSITWGVNVLYTPTANFCTSTPLTFTYRALDASSSQSNIATGSFIVSCVNDAPVASNDSNTTSRNTNVTTFVLANDTDIDHTLSQLSVTWITSITGGTASIVGTGVLFTPTAWVCGTGTFTYRALDASGSLSNTATGTITISCTNSAPVANNDTPSVTEDSISNIFSILSNDTDSDIGDTLSISGIIATTSNGTLTTSGTTQVVYTPDANFCGTDTFTYRARDSFWPTASNTATGTITVTCVNDAPVANNDIRTATGTEDTLLTIFVTANDTDIDNAITSITGLTQPSTGGTLSITWGVNVLYTPTANFCTSTPLTFTYRALDASSSQSNIATGSFIVSCVNDAPVASNDSNTTSRNTNVTTFVLANDTDIDHTLSQLSVTWITSITGGTASIVGTGVLFTPTAWVCGTGTFTYRALDASGSLSNTATGTITISCTNSAPVANNDTPSVTEDSISNIFSILSNDTDSDIGDTLSISGIIATTSNGTLTTSGTTQVVYTPDANFCGTDTFTYRARDSFWPTASNTATGTITVTCVNDAPVANNDIRTATGTEDTLLTIFVTANDTDIDNAITSITGLTQPSTGGTLSITWGVNVLYTPTANFCTSTPLTFTYRALDASSSQSNIATGSFIVSCVNDAPVASNDSNTTSRNTNVTTFVLANDTDIDHTLSQLSVTWITSITGGTASIVGTGVLFTPTAWVCGTGTFTYRALDASGSLSNTATGTITISCTNSAPVANNDTPSVTEDSISNIFSILSNDTDSDIGDTLSISGIIATTSNGTLTTSGTTQVVYTPDANFCGTDTFTYRARDSFWPTASNTATGTITVTCVNDAPVANNDIRTATGTEDTLLTIFVTANDTDIDNAITSITGLTQPSTGGTLSITWGVNVLYTPTANFCTSTPLTFTYRALDASSSQSNIATGSFIVSCVNDAPVASNDSNTTSRNTNVTTFVLANDTDIDHTLSQLSVTWITSITGGTASIVGTGVLFTPTAWVCGTGTFTYRALDASGSLSNTATGTITISCTNSAPVANNDTPSVTEDSISNIFSILSNDTDSDIGDTLSISGIIATTSNGTLTTSGTTQVVYTPDANFCGTDTFTYRARDSFWPTASNTATGTITVTCVNDAPVANNDIRTATGTEDTLLTIFVTANDTDIDNAITSITGLTQPSTGGTLSITWGVNVLYTPTANFCTSTPLTFTYRALDASSSQSNIATGSFIVSCVNDAPVASNDSNTTSRNTNVTTFVLANDTDIDHTLSQLSVTWITSITGGTASIVGTGVLFTPTAWVCGTGTFTYRALDASGSLSNTATGTITISCTNSAPVANNDTPSVTEDSISNIFSILSNDTDSDIGDTLSISGIIATTSNGTLTTSGTTQVVYTPDANFCGTDTFTYRARDSFWPTASNTATGTITVTCVNDAPVANNDIRTATGTEDTLLTIFVTANDTDIDNAITSITGLTQPSTGGTLSITWGVNVLYTPTANFCTSTPLTFTYRALDASSSQSNIATGSFIVSCVNDAPVASNDSNTTSRNTNVTTFVLANDTDIDHTLSQLSVTWITSITGGTASIVGTGVLFTPTAWVCGTGTFTYRALDASGSLSNTATGTITISCTNSAPVANNDTPSVTEDSISNIFSILSNDTDSDIGDTLSISGIIATTSNGTLTTSGTTQVVYTPDLNFCGTDTFTYRARDSFWPTASNTATGTITVTCVNDAPVANNDIRTATGTEDSILTIAVLSNDTDSDNLPSELSLTGLTQVATGGTLSRLHEVSTRSLYSNSQFLYFNSTYVYL
jgi:VCBS repeat-containing protein